MNDLRKAYLLAIFLTVMWGLNVPKTIGACLIGFLILFAAQKSVLAHLEGKNGQHTESGQ